MDIPEKVRLESTIFLKDRMYIPKNLVSDPSLLSFWVRRLYDEAMCKRCDNKPQRHNAQCSLCPGYKKPAIKMWSEVPGANGIDYYCLPIGFIERNLKILKIDLTKVTIEDRRCEKQFESDLRFTGKLREGEIINGVPTANQKYLVNKWLEFGHGLIKAPTRSGKCVMGTYIACTLKTKTLIIAHQTELLENFYRTFEDLTNLKELREASGKPIVKMINDIDDFEEGLDVALVNYQKFIRKDTGADRVEKLVSGRFGFFCVDECHQANAFQFSKFIKALDSKFRLGLSATPHRKDCLEGSAKIYTNQGIKSIEDIVECYKQDRDSIQVWSKDMQTGSIELKPILQVHKVSSEGKTLITVNDKVMCTKDHEFL